MPDESLSYLANQKTFQPTRMQPVLAENGTRVVVRQGTY